MGKIIASMLFGAGISSAWWSFAVMPKFRCWCRFAVRPRRRCKNHCDRQLEKSIGLAEDLGPAYPPGAYHEEALAMLSNGAPPTTSTARLAVEMADQTLNRLAE